MKIKQLSYLIGLSMFLYGCSSTGTEKSVNHTIPAPVPVMIPDSDSEPIVEKNKTDDGKVEKIIKERGDGSHLKGLPMTRDFILDSQDDFRGVEEAFKRSESKGSKKVFSVKPTGDIKPRAVILLTKRVFSRTRGEPLLGGLTFNLNVKRKNITICEGFLNLPPASPEGGKGPSKDRDNEVITFMPVLGSNINNIPTKPDLCNVLIEDSYDYKNAQKELDFLFGQNIKGKSPYLVVYESEDSPYSSMILSLGEFSPSAIKALSKDWSGLIAKVYKHGDTLDPVIGMAIILASDPDLQEAQREDNKANIITIAKTTVCAGSSVVGPSIITTPACIAAIRDAADKLGYPLPEGSINNIINILSSIQG